jgi:short-subunit dehydrogenase
MKTVLITGASSGIGNATAKLFFEKGWNVIATMKDVREAHGLTISDRMHVAQLDVANPDVIKNIISSIVTQHTKIDVLVNNAGYGLIGPLESISSDSIERQFATNVFGTMNITRELIPFMRESGGGAIVNISSMMGRISFPFFSPYVASKWAVEGFSEALQIELRPYNIHVKLVEPGTIKTNFFANVERVSENTPPYTHSWSAVWKNVSGRGDSGASAESAARVVYKAATSASLRMRHSVDFLSRLLPFLRSISPIPLFQFILSKTVR